MDQLIRSGKVSRGFLGISIQPLTRELAKEFGLPDESSGVLVGGVQPRGSAAKAGVQDGDIITEVNGKKVGDPRTLQLVVSQTPPNTKVTLKVLRTESGSKKPVLKTLSATLSELPRNAFARPGMGMEEEEPDQEQTQLDALDGVEVADLDARVRRQFEIPANVRGALVVNVDQNSNAAESGLAPGDVIMEINRRAVHNADEAVEMSNKSTGDRILLRVYSPQSGSTRYLVVDNTKN
jgi:serine protease Do